MTVWDNARRARDSRLQAGARYAQGKRVARQDATALLEAVIRPGDRVCLEGDNQKQADLLAVALAAVDSSKIHDLHMVQSGVVLPEHLDVFEKGIAKRLDYAYSGPQSQRIARLLFGGQIELGAVHTYLELFARYYVDLTPAGGVDRRGKRGSRRQSVHGPQYRGYPGDRGGHCVQGRHRHCPGQRDRRQTAACRHPGRLGELRHRERQAVLRRTVVHPRSRPPSPRRRYLPRCWRSRASMHPMASSA